MLFRRLCSFAAWQWHSDPEVNLCALNGLLNILLGVQIVEWTEGPEQAIEFSIHLNDKYEIDGRDSNGYVGLHVELCWSS